MISTDKYKVVWKHINNNISDKIEYKNCKGKKPLSTSSTMCLIVDKNNNIVAKDIAICSPLDSFNKSIGRRLSFKRAVHNLDKEDKKVLWKKYRETLN